MSNNLDVAIIGAGPYGLSLAAHLPGSLRHRVFGAAMGTWQAHMPPGMCLKSDGFACDLYDPEREFTLSEFCRARGIPYQDRGLPVALETFTSYGLEFQRRFVPDLDSRFISEVSREGSGFRLTLGDGDTVYTRRVILAVGLTRFATLPEALRGLPEEFVSHSSQCEHLDRFAGRDVIVIGAGASAIDMALALHDAGARPTLITRRSSIPFHGKAPERRSLVTRLKSPWSGLGPGWRSRLACDLPLLFHRLPADFRIKVVQKHLGPAPGWFTSTRFRSHVTCRVGLALKRAHVLHGKIVLTFNGPSGEDHDFAVDHVVAGTGYEIDVNRLPFLEENLRAEIRMEHNSPVLSTHFESSVPGLYFTGPCAAYSFGPLLRFAFGAGFASRRMSKHLNASARKQERRESSWVGFDQASSSSGAPPQ